MLDQTVYICLAFFAVGSVLAIIGKGSFQNTITIVGAVISTLALIAVPLHWNGVF